jgi:hypothetical protein
MGQEDTPWRAAENSPPNFETRTETIMQAEKKNWKVIEDLFTSKRYKVWSTPECPIACGQNEFVVACGLSRTAADKLIRGRK